MSTCLETDALPERLQEYTNVLSFVEERLSFSHHRSLFVFGACGCGKTSTVLRALRRVSHRPMSCDRFRTAPTDEISSPASSSGSGTSPISEAARRSVKRSRDSDVGAAVSPLVASLPNLFAASHRRVQGHYVNCADLTAAQLCDAVVASLRGVQPRLDAATRALMEHIENLPKRAAATRRRATRTSLAAHFEEAADADTLHNTNNNNNASAAASGGFVQNSSAAAPPRRSRAALTTPLHVMVLDEVEYVRAGAAATLTELAALSIECATQLALVFISNQRDLVHVPSALLKELPFAAYSAEELERIGANIIERSGELMRHSTVQLSSGLMTFIARKALHEHSGDVRQVAAMCRRLIHTAQDEIPGNETEKNNGTQRTPVRRRLSGGAGGGSGVINASPPSPPAATIMQAPTLTLAQSHKVLRGPSVDQRVAEYVAGMPEQMLYVLSCLVALNVRQQRSKTQQSMAVGGALRGNIRSTTSAAAAAEREPGTFTMRAVHQLYTALMAQQCFPSMNAAGIATAIEGFADLGILSRPQRRGNEDVFSFNGVWTLEAMQSALTARGEVICQERVDCGLDAGENRFAAVLRELSALVGA